jgi:hypothetical protein
MIIRNNGSTRLLITQPDHAALAGRIMQHWAAGAFAVSPRRAEILLAVAEHDNGWHDVDAAPVVDPVTGRLLDFIHAPDAIRQAVWPRGVKRLADTPYAAALVAQHALEIYVRYRADPAWQPFFTAIEAARERHLHRASTTLEELRRDYFFVRAGDLLSLTFCNAWRDEQALDARFVARLHADELVVTPDPFGGRSVLLEVVGIELSAAPFSSASGALAAFQRGRVCRVRGAVTGAGA